MSNSTTKQCRSCNKEVDPKHTGKCPHCNKEEGYHITVTVNEVLKITDSLNVTKKTLENAYDDQLEKVSKKISDATDSKKKQILEITKGLVKQHKEKELDRISKKIEDLSLKIQELKPKIKPETKQKTFTIDAVFVEAPTTAEDAKKSVEVNVKLSTEEALSKISDGIEEIKTTTSETHKKITKLSSKKTLFLGLIIGITASSVVWFLTTISDWIKDSSPIIIANVTNSTIQP